MQASAILGWEVVEPYIYKIKYPDYFISGSAIDTMEDIIFGSLAGNYLWNSMTSPIPEIIPQKIRF